MIDSIELIIYTKPECGLCDEMKEVVESVSRKIPIRLKQVDITRSAELESEYGLDIPLLFYMGECLAKHKVNGKVLRKKIEKLLAEKPFGG